MNKDKLSNDCQLGLSQRDIATKWNVAHTTVRYWLKKHALKTFKVRTTIFKCIFCENTDPNLFYGKRKKICKFCENKRTAEKNRINKRMAVEYKGGECEECGYDKYIGALEFHHTDPTQKDLRFVSFTGWSEKRIKTELDKCKLLCSNCHREEHGLRNKSG